MTSEICMMNRLAVVLAADSATTVSHWNGGERVQRYFKGANKIFQLSDHHPVGLMIYDSADMLRVPWELIVKAFRSDLGAKSFNTVDEYAQEFLSYLTGKSAMFPRPIQDETVSDAARAVVASIVGDVTTDASAGDWPQRMTDKLDGLKTTIEQDGLPAGLEEDAANRLLSEIAQNVKDMFTKDLIDLLFPAGADPSPLFETAVNVVITNPAQHLSTTGLVFAGFGDHQLFPQMVSYQSQGIIADVHIFERLADEEIDHERPTSINSFAQTSMIDTFAYGISFDQYRTIKNAVASEISALVDAVATESGGNATAIKDRASLEGDAVGKISDAVLTKARDEHSLPLRTVISFLPVDEMAELAETLITLQSLKEKVTKPSEEVGGPVDVAVITKHEGLVWIRRKHYFDPALNSRFKLRQAAQLA